MKRVCILFLIILSSSNCFSQENWQIIEPNWSGHYFFPPIYYINSFDDGQLILLPSGNIYHLFPDDLSNVPLINFTDWGGALRGVSGKGQSEMILYGMNNNSFTFPLNEYRRDYYRIFKDTSRVVDIWNYKFQIYGYEANNPYNAILKYSNVNIDGDGISVAKYKMWTYSYKNWIETDRGINEDYEAHYGAFHNNKSYIVAVNKLYQIDILSTIDGSEWVLESSPRNFKYNSKEPIVKLIINNQNDYYIITKKAIYYSIDSGVNWNIIDLKFYEINDATLRNQNEIFFCGNFGLIAKLDLNTYEYKIFSNTIKFELFTLYFTQDGDCWIGGNSQNLLKYTFGTSVDDTFYKLEIIPSIFPNPTSDFITIAYSSKGLKPFDTADKVHIFDMLGVEVGLSSLIDGNIRIDVSHLPVGVYYVRIGAQVEKFVKM